MYNLILPYTATPITNQKSSGQCWLFASTNVVRYTAEEKLGTAEFELSQTLCWCFYGWVLTDRNPARSQLVTRRVIVPFLLGGANYSFGLSNELAKEPVDSRIVWYLVQACRTSNGGQYEMVRLPTLECLLLFTSTALVYFISFLKLPVSSSGTTLFRRASSLSHSPCPLRDARTRSSRQISANVNLRPLHAGLRSSRDGL